MPKSVINDKSGKKNTSMNFFLDDEVIKFKENKKEIIKEVKGEKAAKEVDTHKDIQLEAAIKFLNTPTQKNTPSPKK